MEMKMNVKEKDNIIAYGCRNMDFQSQNVVHN
jgi:hypothetical protein